MGGPSTRRSRRSTEVALKIMEELGPETFVTSDEMIYGIVRMKPTRG